MPRIDWSARVATIATEPVVFVVDGVDYPLPRFPTRAFNEGIRRAQTGDAEGVYDALAVSLGPELYAAMDVENMTPPELELVQRELAAAWGMDTLGESPAS